VGNHRGRSQGGSVMGRLDVASLPRRTGLPLGRVRGRASPFRAKSGFSASIQGSRGAFHAVIGVKRPRCYMRSCRAQGRFIRPMRSYGVPPLGGGKLLAISPMRKASTTRRWRERDLPGPVFKDSSSAGVEVRPTASAAKRAPKGKTSECRWGLLGSWDQSACRIKATKWPGGTSSSQSGSLLSNSPQQPGQQQRRFIHVRRNQHGIVSHS
jgi:hypothetical protein